MQNNVKVLDCVPEETGIQKIEIKCPECGEYQSIFGNWPGEHLVQHKCKKCGFDLILRVTRQEKLI